MDWGPHEKANWVLTSRCGRVGGRPAQAAWEQHSVRVASSYMSEGRPHGSRERNLRFPDDCIGL